MQRSIDLLKLNAAKIKFHLGAASESQLNELRQTLDDYERAIKVLETFRDSDRLLSNNETINT